MTRAALYRSTIPLLALLGLGYLVAMVMLGAQPVQRQLVKFKASGLLHMTPETAQRITLSRAGRQVVVVRAKDGRWTLEDGTPVGEAALTHIETSLKMLHNSAPVREMEPDELIGIDMSPFLLDDPAVIVTVSAQDQSFMAHFGGINPEGFLQYMRIEGDSRVYLMSRFIGAEWVSAFEASERK